jgi:lipoprotein-anchoring transpeptidase ErfK/SrfK
MGWRTARPAALAAAGAAALGVLAGAAVPAGAAAPQVVASRPTTKEAWTARVLLPVSTRAAPRANARKTHKLSVTAPYNRGPNVLLVLSSRTTKRDGVWYRLLLTSRPNTASGWVRAEAVQVRRTRYRVVVNLSTRRLSLLRAGRAVGTWAAAVGTTTNPTPSGRFAVSELVRQRDRDGFFGPYIINLTAHSSRLNEFDGGDGRVAIHGTNRPSLLGQRVSHGCIRISNAVARRLGRTIPPGTPVDVLR